VRRLLIQAALRSDLNEARIRRLPRPRSLFATDWGCEIITTCDALLITTVSRECARSAIDACSNAATGQASVKALVYVVGFRAGCGENAGALGSKFPSTLFGTAHAAPVPLERRP
jgi:hypothetical protein